MPARADLLAARRAIGIGGAGVFSGLFGVGGGTVIVPLLILWLGFGEREATGTSLLAIVLIAVAGVAAHAGYGNVHVDDGLLIGLPAVGGVARRHLAAAADPRRGRAPDVRRAAARAPPSLLVARG